MAIKGKDNRMVTSRNYNDGRVSRSKVSRHHTFRTTFSAGKLFPIYCEEVLPNQNKKVDCAELVRSITPLGPTMDNSFLDIFFFFVPFRLVWDHWEEFIAGYNKEAWTQDVVYTVPKIKQRFWKTTPSPHAVSPETINDYLHSFLDYLPGATDPNELASYQQELAANYHDAEGDEAKAAAKALIDKMEAQWNEAFGISALYPRAYVKIWNDWFRDENLQDEYELYTGDNDEYADAFAFNLLSADALPNAAKYHNRFTSALPQPQKGPDVLIPMTGLQVNPPVGQTFKLQFGSDGLKTIFGNNANGIGYNSPALSSSHVDVTGTNLLANNVSNTIRMLRLATQTELLLARDARGGTRYVESLLSHFGVHNGDARLQRSEYLGSKQIPLQVMQVTNTAASSDNPLGNVGGQSVTKDNGHYFSKAFSEHGVVFGVAVVRTNISYSSGVRKQFQRFNRFDFIWPEFKHIGDVPLYSKELDISRFLLNEPGSYTETVFGYTPYGSELREGYNYNNGLFRARAENNLAYLTYQETYGAVDEDFFIPILSDDWIKQDSAIVSRTLAVQTGPQFYALFDIYTEDVIPLDPTSDPGLMDHF